MSIDDLTIRAGWIAGLAIVALVLAGWRKTARAQSKPPRSLLQPPKRVPYQVSEVVAPPYKSPGLVRRIWSVVAGSGIAVVIGAVLATVTAFGVAAVVTTLTNLLKK